MPARMRESGQQKAEQLSPGLSIGEISRLTNVSPSTLRDWENQGIIQPRRQGTRRRYSTADVDRVLTARELRRQSFSPAAIAATMAPEAPDSAAAAPSETVDVGRMLREARLARGSSLREVASAVNISVSHLSTVERGGVQPSLALLQRLAGCYSIDVADLFGGPAATAGPRVRKLSEADVLLSDDGRVRVRAVARSTMICSDMYEAGPGGGSGGSYEHDGEEYALVLEGEAEFLFSDTHTVTLGPGESVSFNSRIPHRWVNCGPGTLRMLWTNARPPRQASEADVHADAATTGPAV